jgi:hypothetical protein
MQHATPPECLFNFVTMPRLKALTMKHKSYKENYTISSDIYNYCVSAIICATYIVLGINPKTSGQGHYVQLPFNKQGFQQSLAGQTMNNHYYCKPTPPPPTPQ